MPVQTKKARNGPLTIEKRIFLANLCEGEKWLTIILYSNYYYVIMYIIVSMLQVQEVEEKERRSLQ